MSYYPKFKISIPITSSLSTIERTRGFLEAAQLSQEWLSKMRDRALVLEAHHTTHIEGTHLNLDQSEKLKNLVEKGLISQIGTKRAARYRIDPLH